MEQNSDPLLVYISEKGHLHAPFQNKRTSRFDVFSAAKRLRRDESDESIANPAELKSDLLLPCSQPLTSVMTLKSLTLNFVARNILLVDSLIGIPELMGEEIFSEVVKLGLVNRPSGVCQRILKLFSDAYSDAVVGELSLSYKVKDLNFCFEALASFQHLRKLDLSGCKLWTVEEDCIVFMSQLTCLTYLSLRDAGFDNNALRRLVNGSVYRKGLLQLRTLDLSCNESIDQKALHFLHRFQSLKALNLSDTNVSMISPEEQKKLRMILLTDGLEYPFCNLSFVSKGWAASVVNGWIEDENRRLKEAFEAENNKIAAKDDDTFDLSARRFYTKSKRKQPPEDQLRASLKIKVSNFAEQETMQNRMMHLVSRELVVEVNGKQTVRILSELAPSLVADSSSAEHTTVQKDLPSTVPSAFDKMDGNLSIYTGSNYSESIFSASDCMRMLSNDDDDDDDDNDDSFVCNKRLPNRRQTSQSTRSSTCAKPKPSSLLQALNSSTW